MSKGGCWGCRAWVNLFRLISYIKSCISANENWNISWTMGISLVRFGVQGHGDIGLIKKPSNGYKKVWKLMRTVLGYHLGCSIPGWVKYRKLQGFVWIPLIWPLSDPGALTLTQAAELSHLSPNCILLRIKKKEIFASLIGTHYVISKKSIIEYISSEKMLRSSTANNPFRVLIEKYYDTTSNFEIPI